jgi:hypothetical protein
MPWFSITLRIIGDTLDPKEITTTLKHQPTIAYQKGDDMLRSDGSIIKAARFGRWSLRFTPESLPFEDCCDAVEHILTLFPDNIEVWRSITSLHRTDFFIGLRLEAENRGIEVSPKLMLSLGERGVKIGFDIYSQMSATAPAVPQIEVEPQPNYPFTSPAAAGNSG